MAESRRRFVGRVLLTTSALWACLAVAFVLTGGGDRQAVGLMVMLGVMCTAGELSGEWGRRSQAVEANGIFSTAGPWRRFVVIAGVTAAALTITVFAFTPRRDEDWWGAVAAWGIGFAGLAVMDALTLRKSRRRLDHEPPPPGSTGYPSR